MTIKFLLFRGNWENEGKFYALESEKTIIILAVGQDYSTVNTEEKQLGYDYLKENHSKIQGIIINNTDSRNFGSLTKICGDFGNQIPIYTSVHSKLILHYLFPQIKNRVQVMTPNSPEVKIGDFTCSFFPLNSYLLGNCAVAIHHSHNSFYLIEDLLLSNYCDNELIFNPNFLTEFSSFLSQKRKNVYLITSFHNIKWQSNNSIFFLLKNLNPFADRNSLWILYEFDWLHILELLMVAYQHRKKIRIPDQKFLLLIRQILAKSFLWQAIGKEGEITLLVVDYTNIETKLHDYLKEISPEQKSDLRFVIGISPVIGSEEKLARVVDYLHDQSEKITNLSKNECFKFRTNLNEWKLLLQLLQPSRIFLLQNSYKNSNYFPYFPGKGKFFPLSNYHFCQIPPEKIFPLKIKKTLTTLEEILIKQRKNLQEEGLLIIFLLVNWEKEKLELKKLKLEILGISSVLNLSKLEKKINNWWSKQLTYGLTQKDSIKTIREVVRKRLNELAKVYLSNEHEIEIEELPILLFFNKKNHTKEKVIAEF